MPIGQFSKGALRGWQEKSFNRKTDYRFELDATLNPPQTVLKSHSDRSASGLFFKKRIDLEKTPILHWSWKTEKRLTHVDERKKTGDDFVARVYVVIDGGVFFWNTRALNYVWSSSLKVGETWPNPFTSNAVMMAVESGDKKIGQWLNYRRNVREDLQNFLGKSLRYIDAIAIMTDSDNSQQQSTTYYGDIYFTEE